MIMEEHGLEISDFAGDAAFDYVSDNFLFALSARGIPATMLNAVMHFEVVFCCRRGWFRIDEGGTVYEVRAGEMLAYTDGKVMRGAEASDDVDIAILGCTWELIEGAKDIHVALWPMTDYVSHHAVISVKDDYLPWLGACLRRLRTVCESSTELLRNELVSTLFQLFIYEFARMIADKLRNIVPRMHGRRSEINHMFFDILITNYGRAKSISAVAAAMHITPKYLSRVIKETTGERAMSYIHKYAMRAIGQQMKYTDKTIKQIAFQQEFPSLAAFGKYVKAQTGMSPTEYRKRLKSRQADPV